MRRYQMGDPNGIGGASCTNTKQGSLQRLYYALNYPSEITDPNLRKCMEDKSTEMARRYCIKELKTKLGDKAIVIERTEGLLGSPGLSAHPSYGALHSLCVAVAYGGICKEVTSDDICEGIFHLSSFESDNPKASFDFLNDSAWQETFCTFFPNMWPWTKSLFAGQKGGSVLDALSETCTAESWDNFPFAILPILDAHDNFGSAAAFRDVVLKWRELERRWLELLATDSETSKINMTSSRELLTEYERSSVLRVFRNAVAKDASLADLPKQSLPMRIRGNPANFRSIVGSIQLIDDRVVSALLARQQQQQGLIPSAAIATTTTTTTTTTNVAPATAGAGLAISAASAASGTGDLNYLQLSSAAKFKTVADNPANTEEVLRSLNSIPEFERPLRSNNWDLRLTSRGVKEMMKLIDKEMQNEYRGIPAGVWNKPQFLTHLFVHSNNLRYLAFDKLPQEFFRLKGACEKLALAVITAASTWRDLIASEPSGPRQIQLKEDYKQRIKANVVGIVELLPIQDAIQFISEIRNNNKFLMECVSEAEFDYMMGKLQQQLNRAQQQQLLQQPPSSGSPAAIVVNRPTGMATY